MRVLLIGGGRMGQRHLTGCSGVATWVDLVDPSPQAHEQARKIRATGLRCHATIGDVPRGRIDAAIVAATAAGRLEQLEAVLALQPGAVLLEKPVEQSRERLRAIAAQPRAAGIPIWVNHYRRSLLAFHALRAAGPFVMTVCSGAMGLGCNGIHWIDFARFLAGDVAGRLLFGEIDAEPIGSGRGTQFRDYGGRGTFAFADGSRLLLSSTAWSSAPTMCSIVAATTHWMVDQETDRAVVHQRHAGSVKPNYLYGQDYAVDEIAQIERAELPALTMQWLEATSVGKTPPQPPLAQSVASHELLFDLLETSGERHFPIT